MDEEKCYLCYQKQEFETSRINYLVNASIKEGIEYGKKNKAIEIAKNMLKRKMNIDIICDITNLTKAEIIKII